MELETIFKLSATMLLNKLMMTSCKILLEILVVNLLPHG